MKLIRTLLVISVFCIPFFLLAQDATKIPSGYGGVELGMSVDDVKDALKKNSDFGYLGDRDVSLLPGENRVLIETDTSYNYPNSFLKRCWFQFYEDKLYIMTINLNQERVDHYTIYSNLLKKYGEPSSFSPERAVWKNDKVSMSLERPLTLKYMDLEVFNKLQDEIRVEQSATEQLRDMFLEGL